MSALPKSKEELLSDSDLRWFARDWAARISVSLKEIHVRGMSSKWASISSTGRLTLSSELTTIPKRLVEYVIVHELVHLLAPNHGKVFKSFMLAYLPDWEQRHQDIGHLTHVTST